MTTTTGIQGGIILYDERLIDQPDEHIFVPDYWRERDALQPTTGGRGASWLVNRDAGDWVLRHYRRGGAVRFLGDRYAWPGAISRTRPWREWHYLREMLDRGLPVARPVAARIARSGLIWRGDLITAKINQVQPLSAWLTAEKVASAPWANVGKTLARFHAVGAAHPDLNAHNILIQPDQSVWLIDFDRGRWQKVGGAWARHNLERLKRSLIKLSDEAMIQTGWQTLLASYHS